MDDDNDDDSDPLLEVDDNNEVYVDIDDADFESVDENNDSNQDNN